MRNGERRRDLTVALLLVLVVAPVLVVGGLFIIAADIAWVFGPPPEPPLSVLSYGREERSGVSYVGCWREKRRLLPDNRACRSGEAGAYDKRGRPVEALRLPSGTGMIFAYDGASAPKEVRVLAARTDVAPDPQLAEAQQGLAARPGAHLPPFGLQTEEIPTRQEGRRAEASADLEPGRYLVIVSVRVDDASAEGEAFYDFNVIVGDEVGVASRDAPRVSGAPVAVGTRTSSGYS